MVTPPNHAIKLNFGQGNGRLASEKSNNELNNYWFDHMVGTILNTTTQGQFNAAISEKSNFSPLYFKVLIGESVISGRKQIDLAIQLLELF